MLIPIDSQVRTIPRFSCACASPIALGIVLVSWTLLPIAGLAASWEPAPGPLVTRWAKDVDPATVHSEYPRPQMTREHWQNLNGLWEYAIVPKEAAQPATWDGQILVPFPIESSLSGVLKRVSEQQRLWYRRTFKIPSEWEKQRVLLHFGAVDWEATVYVNGRETGAHRGGYDAFTLDITDALRPSGEQELIVAVWDPTDAGSQPRGKQVRAPNGIWYTPTTGIWQTAWLEPVPQAYIQSLRITPDVDGSTVTLEPTVQAGGEATLEIEILDDGATVGKASITDRANDPTAAREISPRVTLKVPNAKLWSPDAPFLYDLRIAMLENGKKIDQVRSYFGMRKIALTRDSDGIQRLFLNNQALFQYGPLDQGFWPDGLYTAPTDEALRYDIEMLRKLGFNMARKHVKVEPDRWYYWCDKLGLLVWQDMPSGDKYIGRRDPDITRTPESGRQFETELGALVHGFYNHPCIVMWVPYNEGWGQWDTARIVELVKTWDPTRLVDCASGWTDRRVGDVHDVHAYPGPAVPPLEEERAAVLGEFGGLGLPVKGHTWQEEKNWGYRSYSNGEELTDAYLALLDKLHPLTGANGLAAAVYTQTTDVEIEVNGLMTYDRALVKMDPDAIAAAAERLYTPLAKRVQQGNTLVPPATPLVAHDPYFSIWSPADKLTDADTVHWTGRPHRLASLVRIDGRPYRIMGIGPRDVPALRQTDLQVLPTRTIYSFEGAGMQWTLTFMSATLPDDLDILARPVTYVVWEAKATDGQAHDTEIYFDAAAELAVNDASQAVAWSQEKFGDLLALKIGSKDQPVLARKGDDVRIDWGYLYAAAPAGHVAHSTIAPSRQSQQTFARNGSLPDLDTRQPRSANDDSPVAALTFELRQVDSRGRREMLMLAYDDLYSIQYMNHNLRPYWRRNGWEAADLLQTAAREFESLAERCAAFDRELMDDLTRAGGELYAKLAALAYRQCFAASKFVADDNGQPLSFSKENFSNGCIATSDVFYPMSPQFLLFGPSVAKSFLVPFMNYAAGDRWKFPFAPHDLGTYPHANGQVYGGGERTEQNQMPVEESGNLLILMAAVAEMEGNADFAGLYWPQLEQWAEYLKAKGFDPENQLCTDDFAGHLAHNVNLSAKAICGLASFAKLCAMRGDQAKADIYQRQAKEFVRRWLKEADDGDHFRLAFDRPGTWSQKYNIVWDSILGLDLWPAEAIRKEMDYYRKVQNTYGLPLDNRSLYTKLDWVLWTATLPQDRSDFDALVDPVFRFLNETPDRVPMSDWYWTQNARVRGFQARPVVGGVFIQMLHNHAIWTKYARRDRTRAKAWATLPVPPITRLVVPTAENEPVTWRYTFRPPDNNWFGADFDDSSWSEGPAGFGTAGTPSAVVRTTWNTRDIWMRRTFQLSADDIHDVGLQLHHDEDAEIYLNGVLAGRASGYTTSYEHVPLMPAGLAALKPGRNSIAIHCHQTGGGQYIDAGLVEEVPPKKASRSNP